MIQGTTPTHVFTLPIEAETIKKIRITYQQLGRNVFEKTEKDVTFEGKKVKVTLSQNDTFLFREKHDVKLQLKILTTSGEILSHKPIIIDVGEILNKEVLE